MAEHRDHHEEIRQLGAQVVALSVDPPETSAALRASLELPFLLLSDPQREVVEGWGLLNPEKGGIAYPAVFVLDRDRRVRYRSLDRLASRVSSRDVVGFLRSGRESAPAPRRSLVIPSLWGLWQSLLNILRHGTLSPRRPPCPC